MNLQGNGHHESSPIWRFVLLGLAAVIALVLIVRLGDRLLGPRQTVLVAAEDLGTGDAISSAVLVERRMRVGSLPPDTTADRTLLEGLRLNRPKRAGEPFVPDDFAARTPDAGSMTKIIPAGRVLMTLQIPDNAAPFPDLRRGDLLNIVGVGASWHGSVAQNAYMIGWIQPRQEQAARDRSTVFGVDVTPPTARKPQSLISLLLGVRPIDVMPLAQAQAAGARLSVVVHGRRETAEGQLLDVRGPRSTQVEVISGDQRQMVTLSP